MKLTPTFRVHRGAMLCASVYQLYPAKKKKRKALLLTAVAHWRETLVKFGQYITKLYIIFIFTNDSYF